MATKQEVEIFLNQFNTKLKIWGIFFLDDRDKNKNTLEILEITPAYRRIVIESLSVEDYVQGPIIDSLNEMSDLWVFGKDVKGNDVYIKISLGYENGQTICISFHLAEFPIQFPFKKHDNESK